MRNNRPVDVREKTIQLKMAEVRKLTLSCREKDAEIARLKAEVERLKEGCSCSYAGPGRGDCEHFVGLPGKSIAGQHDGPDDTVDVYGKPNGWCWHCWLMHKISSLRASLAAAEDRAESAERAYAGLSTKYYELLDRIG